MKVNRMIITYVVLFIAIVAVLLATVLFELYTQLSRYQTYWNKQNDISLSKENQYTYVALGDSAAQGVGATSPEKGYVGVIAKELTKRTGADIRTVNLSKSGAKIKDVLDTQLPRLKDAKLTNADVITIEIGANDMLSFDAKRFESEMDQLMSQLPKQTLISDIPYFGSSRFKRAETDVATANTIMQKLAKKHGFELVPLHDRVKSNDGVRIFAADWFHPSNYSYRTNWAYVFLEQMKH